MEYFSKLVEYFHKLVEYDDEGVTSLFFVKQNLHHLDSSLGHRGARTKDSGYASLVEEVVVLGRNDTACNHHNILTTKLFQLFNQLRDERLMTCRK